VKFLPLILILVALVAVMSGSAQRGLRAGQSILFVIAGLIVMVLLFSLINDQA
jgi:hypothetical protein